MEKIVTEWMEFYKKIGVEIPADFEAVMHEALTRNAQAMSDVQTTLKYDQVLLVPPVSDLKQFVEKVTGGKFFETDDCTNAGGVAAVTSQEDMSKNRVVLTSSAVNPLASLTAAGAMITAGEAESRGALSFLSLVIMHRFMFEKHGVHLDADLFCFTSSKCGEKVAGLSWNSSADKLMMFVSNPDFASFQHIHRPSKMFA